MLKQMDFFFMILNTGLVKSCECEAASLCAKSESARVCKPLQWQWITDGLCEQADGVEEDFKHGETGTFLITSKQNKSHRLEIALGRASLPLKEAAMRLNPMMTWQIWFRVFWFVDMAESYSYSQIFIKTV